MPSSELDLVVPLSDEEARQYALLYEVSSVNALKDRTGRLLARLTPRLDLAALKAIPADRRDREVRQALEGFLDREEPIADPFERDQVVQALLDELLGLGPLEALLRDDSISEIMVNGSERVFVERGGRLEEVASGFRDNDHVLQVLERIVARVGRRIDESAPMVDARLADGSRVNAVVPPLALHGPTLTIRRFGKKPMRLEDLYRKEALTAEMAVLLTAAVRGRLNVLVSGGTGSGKTTLLNVLAGFISERERIVTIEDAAELQLQQRHVVTLEARPAGVEGQGEVSIRDLVRNALRMRPDRIVVGECRGGEALDMLEAMNTGHDGSMTTLHANSARDALTRLETMVLMAGYDLPLRAIRRHIASAIQLIIQAERLADGSRKVTSMTEVVGMEGDTIVTQDIFLHEREGVESNGRVRGQFVATGVRPVFAERLQSAGCELPARLFKARVL